MSAPASSSDAFISICHPTSLLLVTAGMTTGIIFGSIPGLSAAMVVVLFLPLTFSITPSIGVNLLTAVHIGGILGGPISAILPSVPGTASSIATCFDGHPMAENGKADRALGYDTVFSFLGFVFFFLALTLYVPLLADITLKFTPTENFGISLFVLTIVAVLASGSIVKGVLAGMPGFIFALVDMAPTDGTPRFTFGSSSLMAGFGALPTLIGIFAISEILITAKNVGNGKVEVMEVEPIKGLGFTWREFVYQVPNAIHSAPIGTGIGILLGVGGSTSGMLSYVTAKNMSKHPDEFGKGCPDGIVVTETASNAITGGAMIPLLVLDVPGDDATATILGGFLIRGLSADPSLFARSADVVYGIFATCMLYNPFMLVIEFFGTEGFVRLLEIPKHTLMPFILVLCCVRAYATNNRIFDTQSIILFRAVGYLYHESKLSTTLFVFCFLIGEMVEIYLRRGIMQYKSFGTLFKRLIFDAFFFVTIVVMVWPTYKEWGMTGARKMWHALRRDK